MGGKLHITEKISHECVKIYGQGRLWPFCWLLQKLFWSSSFWDIYWDIYLPKRTKLMLPGSILSEVIAKLVYFQKINWVKLVCQLVIRLVREKIGPNFKIRPEYVFDPSLVFGPNCRRARWDRLLKSLKLNISLEQRYLNTAYIEVS